MRRAWIRLEFGLPAEIYKSRHTAFELTANPVRMDRRVAVTSIRNQLYGQQQGQCANCDQFITRNGAHMHEKLNRGEFDENGYSGRVSLENSVLLCADCHLKGEHGDRNPRFGEEN